MEITKWNWDSLSAKEIIEEANRRYPVGTEYIHAGIGPSHHFVTEQMFSIQASGCIAAQSGQGLLMKNFKWARVVTKEEDKTVVLFSFPLSGHCTELEPTLLNYLRVRFPRYWKCPKRADTIVSWNATGYWFCVQSAKSKRYSFKELEPHIGSGKIKQDTESIPKKHLASNPGLPFKVGDYFDVLKQPSTWASPGQCPLDTKSVVYPFRNRRVEKIEQKSTHIYIFDGEYGWCYYPNKFILAVGSDKGNTPSNTTVSLILSLDEDEIPMSLANTFTGVKTLS